MQAATLRAPAAFSSAAGRAAAARRAAVRQRSSRPLVVAPKAALVAPEYGYVLVSTAATAALLQWQAIRVAIARKKYDVAYPAMYAPASNPNAQVFNCTQRAHQNTVEVVPALLALVALFGLVHPLTAAALNAVWVVGRVLYTLSYSTGDPSARIPGAAISGLTYLGLIVATAVAGVKATGLLA